MALGFPGANFFLFRSLAEHAAESLLYVLPDSTADNSATGFRPEAIGITEK